MRPRSEDVLGKTSFDLHHRPGTEEDAGLHRRLVLSQAAGQTPGGNDLMVLIGLDVDVVEPASS